MRSHVVGDVVSPATKVTLADVARHCGVSRSAVANVLLGTGSGSTRVSSETTRRIHQAALQLEYIPNRLAQTLRGRQSRQIGVVMDWETAPAARQRIAEIEKLACAHHYQILVTRAPHFADLAAAKSFLNQFVEIGAAAVILMDRLRDPTGQPLDVQWQGMPHLICHGEAAQIAGRGGVLPGVTEGSRLCVEHLLASGRQRIGMALLGGPLTAARRCAGFRRGFAEAGLAFPADRLWTPPQVDGAQILSPELADQLVRRLVHDQGCDAVIVENDHWAARVLQALQRQGCQVPGQVALIGYGNLDLGDYLSPALTTVDECDGAIAEALFARVLAALAGTPLTAECVDIAPRLIIRGSA